MTEQQRRLLSATTESEPHDPIAVALQQLWSEALHAPGHLVRWFFRQLDFFFFFMFLGTDFMVSIIASPPI